MNWTFRYVLKYMKFHLMKVPVNKSSSCFDYYYSGALSPGQSAQQFKIQYHFGVFDLAIGLGKWYDDIASQALRCIC